MLRTTLLATALLALAACSSNSTGGGTGTGPNSTSLNGETGVERVPAGTVDQMTLDTMNIGGVEVNLTQDVGSRVWFDYDSSQLNSESQATLAAQAAWMKQHPNLTVVIEGHADERGTREYNLALGERRAQAVKDYLGALGIPDGRVDTVSYGKERPELEGTGDSVWRYNRRAHTAIN